jgi:hypothetical protein
MAQQLDSRILRVMVGDFEPAVDLQSHALALKFRTLGGYKGTGNCRRALQDERWIRRSLEQSHEWHLSVQSYDANIKTIIMTITINAGKYNLRTSSRDQRNAQAG